MIITGTAVLAVVLAISTAFAIVSRRHRQPHNPWTWIYSDGAATITNRSARNAFRVRVTGINCAVAVHSVRPDGSSNAALPDEFMLSIVKPGAQLQVEVRPIGEPSNPSPEVRIQWWDWYEAPSRTRTKSPHTVAFTATSSHADLPTR